MNDGLKVEFKIVPPALQMDGSQSKLVLSTASTPATAWGSDAQTLQLPVQGIEDMVKQSKCWMFPFCNCLSIKNLCFMTSVSVWNQMQVHIKFSIRL